MPAIFRGGTLNSGLSLPLHGNTQPGDLIVVATYDHTVADARMTRIAGVDVDGVWIGYATTLDPIALADGPSGSQQSICATFSRSPLGASVETSGSDDTAEIPSVGATAAIAILTFTAIASQHTASQIPGYSGAISGDTFIAQNRIAYWNGNPPSPAGVSNVSAITGSPAWRTVVIPVGGGRSTVRKHPVDRGRKWPPPRDRSRGRRAGGYT